MDGPQRYWHFYKEILSILRVKRVGKHCSPALVIDRRVSDRCWHKTVKESFAIAYLQYLTIATRCFGASSSSAVFISPSTPTHVFDNLVATMTRSITPSINPNCRRCVYSTRHLNIRWRRSGALGKSSSVIGSLRNAELRRKIY